ncbi:MAG: helix-turn-helix domain-containing protein [Clostridiales bacterium]|nr:helix-turn-helix domain-containing protein [Clostridiales bacterium]
MSENIIYPVQPFFVMDSEYYYKRFLPGSPIAHFYGFNSKEHIEIKNGVIPDGSVDIIFSCGKDSPQAVIAGSVESGTRNIFKENASYFGVRLMPGVLKHFGEAAARDLVGHTMDFSKIMKNPAAVEKICEAETFEEKINGFITSFPEISQKSSVINSYEEIVREITGEIYGAEGNIKISELEKRLVYSRRHLLRVFKEFTGMDIKKFCRIVRFQAAISRINKGNFIALTDVFLDGNYYDQNHFQKEFKEFAAMTPGTYLKMINECHYMNHITLI